MDGLWWSEGHTVVLYGRDSLRSWSQQKAKASTIDFLVIWLMGLICHEFVLPARLIGSLESSSDTLNLMSCSAPLSFWGRGRRQLTSPTNHQSEARKLLIRIKVSCPHEKLSMSIRSRLLPFNNCADFPPITISLAVRLSCAGATSPFGYH